jgi:hypothetical protein
VEKISYEVFDRVFAGFFFESGIYANPTGTTLQRFGYVQNNNINEEVNVMPIRFAGGGTRDVSSFAPGPVDVDGTVTFFPQDWRSVFFAMGSVADAGSPSPYTHAIIAVNSNDTNPFTSGTNNPLVSFTLQDTHETTADGLAFKRTISGCVINSLTISATDGQIVNCEANYVGQSVVFSSGTATTLEARTTRPFVWSDMTVTIPSGTAIEPVKSFSLTINNNLQRPHYLNGSRVISAPIATTRDYAVDITVNANSSNTKTFYESYFIGAGVADGSEFNMMLSVNASTGSRDAYFVFSGCKLLDLNAPSQSTSDVQEQTLSIQPKTVTVAVNDEIFKYGPW